MGPFPCIGEKQPRPVGLLALHLAPQLQGRGQGQLGTGAKRGGRPCSRKVGTEEGEGKGEEERELGSSNTHRNHSCLRDSPAHPEAPIH